MRMRGEEDGEELSLELSIGGKYGKTENLGDKNGESILRRREIQALKRQEARRKREEKVRKWRGTMNDGDKLFLEEQRFQGRVGDREIREKDCILEGNSRRKKCGGNEHEVGLSLFSERENECLLYPNPKVQFLEAKSSASVNSSDSENSNGWLEQCSSSVSDYKGGSNTDTGRSHSTPFRQHQSHDSSENPPRQSSTTRSSSGEEGMASEGPSSHSVRPPQMPYVSATGNGPNGRTVTGFLHRYNTTEVSIVCVCHMSLFSPAEFVKHAGGVDVSHPLRHITVVMR